MPDMMGEGSSVKTRAYGAAAATPGGGVDADADSDADAEDGQMVKWVCG